MKKNVLWSILFSMFFISCMQQQKELSLTSIYVSKMPSKVYYAYDEPLDLTGLEVTAYYSNGSEKVVDGWTSLPKPWTKLKASGTVTVTITYEGKSTDFTITVVAEGEDVPEQPKDSMYVSGSEAAKVISGLTKAGDNVIYVVGDVTADNFSSINGALKSIAVGVTIDFSDAAFTRIPENAFVDCKMLKGIVIPACVSSIGSYAFNGCSGLKNLTIEDADEPLVLGFNHICDGYGNSWNDKDNGKGLFRDCPLENIYLGRNLEYADYNENVGDSPFRKFGYSAFAYISSSALSVEIGSKVTRLQKHIFYYCGSLKKITISSFAQITSIETCALDGCTKLSAFEIPSMVTKIGDYAFAVCENLREITIPASVTSIGNYAFIGCKRLKKLTLEDAEEPLVLGVNHICDGYGSSWDDKDNGQGLFRDCPLESIYLGRNIEYADYNDKVNSSPFRKFGYSAFAYIISSELSVEIGPKVTSIPINSFTHCESLSKVSINPSAKITSIGTSAFYGCKSLSEFIIPSTVTSIGWNVFVDCTNLKKITIPEKVTYIGSGTFQGCTKLESLIFEDGKETLTLGYHTYNTDSNKSKGLFRDCPLETIYLGRNIEYESYNDKSSEAAFYAYGYSAFANIPTLNTVTINVPEGVTSFLIGKYAFRGCSGITSATFTPSTDWYNSSSASMSGGTAVEVSDSSGAASVLKSMGENYLYWKE